MTTLVDEPDYPVPYAVDPTAMFTVQSYVDPFDPWLRVKRRSWRTLWFARTYRVPKERSLARLADG